MESPDTVASFRTHRARLAFLAAIPIAMLGGLIGLGGAEGAFSERRDLVETVGPMSGGSVIGAIVGGLLVGSVPAAGLKLGLGLILIVSALRIFHHTRHP